MSNLFPLYLKAASFAIAALVFLVAALPVLSLGAQIVA